jgi:hypothetical protein
MGPESKISFTTMASFAGRFPGVALVTGAGGTGMFAARCYAIAMRVYSMQALGQLLQKALLSRDV